MRTELEQIYSQHQQAFFSLALAITKNREQAEDAVHEAFVRLCAQSDKTPQELTPYVFGCVRNAALDQIRNRAQTLDCSESLFNCTQQDSLISYSKRSTATSSPGNSQVIETLEQAERCQILSEAIDSLDQLSREVVVLKTWSGLSFDAISQVTGIPSGTADTRYRRALLKLNSVLKERP